MSERHPFIYNEFDIEAARNAGKISERERIIKLLDEAKTYQQLELAIALIKGEK